MPATRRLCIKRFFVISNPHNIQFVQLIQLFGIVKMNLKCKFFVTVFIIVLYEFFIELTFIGPLFEAIHR